MNMIDTAEVVAKRYNSRDKQDEYFKIKQTAIAQNKGFLMKIIPVKT